MSLVDAKGVKGWVLVGIAVGSRVGDGVLGVGNCAVGEGAVTVDTALHAVTPTTMRVANNRWNTLVEDRMEVSP
jgi:hypothetical protein